jgi:hypothetical protein
MFFYHECIYGVINAQISVLVVDRNLILKMYFVCTFNLILNNYFLQCENG